MHHTAASVPAVRVQWSSDAPHRCKRTCRVLAWVFRCNTRLQVQHTAASAPAARVQVSVAGHGAAMAVAKVARIDLLADQWPDLLECIHKLVAPEAAETTREHALECLGFICEEHVHATERFPQQETNRVLTSLVQGMATSQPNGVRLAAARALCDAIEFASYNFDKEAERDYLMQVRCQGPTVACF